MPQPMNSFLYQMGFRGLTAMAAGRRPNLGYAAAAAFSRHFVTNCFAF